MQSPFSDDQGASGGETPGASGDSGNFCFECWGELGPGLHKICDRDKKFENLQKRLSPKTREMLATDEIKKKKEEAKTKGEDTIALASRHGPKMKLSASSSSTSAAAPLVAETSFFKRLMTELNLTGRKTTRAAKIYKEEVGGKVCTKYVYIFPLFPL